MRHTEVKTPVFGLNHGKSKIRRETQKKELDEIEWNTRSAWEYKHDAGCAGKAIHTESEVERAGERELWQFCFARSTSSSVYPKSREKT